jgi:hypothetical protein
MGAGVAEAADAEYNSALKCNLSECSWGLHCSA